MYNNLRKNHRSSRSFSLVVVVASLWNENFHRGNATPPLSQDGQFSNRWLATPFSFEKGGRGLILVRDNLCKNSEGGGFFLFFARESKRREK